LSSTKYGFKPNCLAYSAISPAMAGEKAGEMAISRGWLVECAPNYIHKMEQHENVHNSFSNSVAYIVLAMLF